MAEPVTVSVRLRSNWVLWPAIALWLFIPGFNWLGPILVKVEQH